MVSPDVQHEFASDAWLLQGITRSVPGWLELRNRRLRFVHPDSVVFDLPLQQISITAYPWYYFGGGVKLCAGTQNYRLSFVKPNGAETTLERALGEAGNPAALLVAVSKVLDARTGRRIGRRWRELLGPARTIGRG